MQEDGQVINPADNKSCSARRPQNTGRREGENEGWMIKGSGSAAYRSPSLLAGLLEENGPRSLECVRNGLMV